MAYADKGIAAFMAHADAVEADAVADIVPNGFAIAIEKRNISKQLDRAIFGDNTTRRTLTRIQRNVRKATDAAWDAQRDFSNIHWARREVVQDGAEFYIANPTDIEDYDMLVSYPDLVKSDSDIDGAIAARKQFFAEGWAEFFSFGADPEFQGVL